jgi:hypothetical protein
MDKNGQRSEIDTAVLPGVETPTYNDDFDEVIQRRQISARLKRQTATELGITIAEFDRRLLDGSLHVCNGTGDGVHIGIFHRNGKCWRSLCRKCENIKRRKKQ